LLVKFESKGKNKIKTSCC